jgi:hypothetical protein
VKDDHGSGEETLAATAIMFDGKKHPPGSKERRQEGTG